MKKKQSPVLNELPNYIFGYGSLMEFKTRVSIVPDALYVRPAEIKGYVRGWFARQTSKNVFCTYLGAASANNLKQKTNTVNGILYYVTPQELAATDVFESVGYKRILIPAAKIKMLDCQSLPPIGNVWMYEANLNSTAALHKFAPTKKYPIVQTYLDTCLQGCIQIENGFPQVSGFLKTFISTTLFWNKHIVNDRFLSGRPFGNQTKTMELDKVMKMIF